MKKLWLVGLVAVILCNCGKENEGNSGALPPLPDPDDVCSAMDNIEFMNFCYEEFDANKDGKVSVREAEAVREISFAKREGLSGSLKGIERFPNLERLVCRSYYWASGEWYYAFSFAELDLRYNKMLKEVLLHTCPNLVTLDLSRNTMLEELSVSECNALNTLRLPENLKEISGYDCPTLQKIICYAKNPPKCSLRFPEECVVYVPASSVEAYKTTTLWMKLDIRPLN